MSPEMRLLPWLRLFRAVNLPTVPGDVFVGAAAAVCGAGCAASPAPGRMAMAAAGSCLLYMFGLADNDIVGAAEDRGRPIPDGEVPMRSAKVARAACLASGLLALAASGALAAACALTAAIVAYNRAKRPVLMGMCRGINVMAGAAASAAPLAWPAVGAAAVWTLYIAAVTEYSEGEEANPAKKRRVGLLVGGILWLQLAAAGVFTVADPPLWPVFAAVAAMLACHWTMTRLMPQVSAS